MHRIGILVLSERKIHLYDNVLYSKKNLEFQTAQWSMVTFLYHLICCSAIQPPDVWLCVNLKGRSTKPNLDSAADGGACLV